MLDRADLVLDRDPAHVLPSVSDAAAEPELERQQQPRKHSAVLRQHDSGTNARDADAGVSRRLGGVFPRATGVREEAVARRTLLGEHFVAAVAVVPDGRRRHEHRRLLRELRERPRQQRGALRAALEHDALALGGPALIADARAGEVHDRIDALEADRVDRARLGVPGDFVGTHRVPAHQAQRPMPRGRECADQRGPDQPVRPRHDNVHPQSTYAHNSGGPATAAEYHRPAPLAQLVRAADS